MSWKSEVGRSFAEALLVEHASIYELDSLKQVINWVRVEKVLAGIYNSKTGSLRTVLCCCSRSCCCNRGII